MMDIITGNTPLSEAETKPETLPTSDPEMHPEIQPVTQAVAGVELRPESWQEKQSAPVVRYQFGPRRWEIWFAQLGSHPGTSVQAGCRPVLVISNNISNTKSDTVTVIPLTSKVKKPWFPSHTTISESDVRCLDEKFLDSTVLTEQLTTIPKSAFINVLACVANPQKKKDVIDTIRSYFDFAGKEGQDE